MQQEQGGFAFMMESAGIQYIVERNCELAQVPHSPSLPASKPLYQARESSLVPLCLMTVHFLQKT